MTTPYFEKIISYLPAILILIGVLIFLKILNHITGKRRLSPEYKRTLIPQFLIVVTALFGLLVALMALPITATTRGQVLGLVGVVFTGIIALSSTTFVTNALAGLMLRLIRNFKAGDFIRVNDMFGRITERGLFHTEIQTAERDLTTFPNLYLITNPLTVVRSSGTIVSADLSLGYDLPHQQIEPLLLQAAEQTGLKEPFVQVTHLGDFSITYKISGFLAETKQLLAMRSNLKRAVVDALHGGGVEIVSPNFMNQRVLASDVSIIPEPIREPARPSTDAAPLPDELIFDKADIAEELDLWKAKLATLAQKRSALTKNKDKNMVDAMEKMDSAMAKVEKRIEKINALLNRDEDSVQSQNKGEG